MAASTLRYTERGPGAGLAVALLLLFGALSGVGIAHRGLAIGRRCLQE